MGGKENVSLASLVLVLAPLASSQPAPTSCCETKTVGGVSYTFVREDSAALGYSCLSPCVYERDDQPGTAFCFAQGDQQVVCGDSPGLEGESPAISRYHFFQSGPLCLPIHIMQAHTTLLFSLNVYLSLSVLV